MMKNASLEADFVASKLREATIFESALVVVAAVYFLASVGGRVMGTINVVPAICSGAIVASHSISMWLRWRNASAFWPSIVTLVADCVWASLGSTVLQAKLWEVFWGQILVGESTANLNPDESTANSNQELVIPRSIWATFLVYTILNYQVSFVLSFRQVAIACPIATAVYSIAIIAGRIPMPDSAFMYSHFFMELALFWCGMGLTAYSKRRAERVELSLYELSVAQRQTIIDEKVLRCQAEFKLEAARGKRAPAVCSTTGSHGSCPNSTRPRQVEASEDGSHAKVSIFSAPAIMAPGKLASSLEDAVSSSTTGPGTTDCLDESKGTMDCLPLDAMVWVEGSAAPAPLHELAQGLGQRLLCYDALGNDVRYASVVDVRAAFEDVEWVTVSLEDGTELTMTSDHPVQPKRSAGDEGRRGRANPTVKAADLSPGTDSVMVYRVVTHPVAVKAVSRPVVCQGRGRMYITMQHPDRHFPLVAGPGAQKDVRSMAVGSADAGAAQLPALEMRNTFLGLPADHDLERGVHRARPQSEPRSFKVGKFSLEARPSQVEERPDSSSYRGDSSTLSSPESGEGDCYVQVLDTATETPGDEAKSAVARVSDLLHIKYMGWPSWGSRRHGSSDCRLCDFHGQPHKFGGCRLGRFCDHCHIAEEHQLKKYRGGSKRKKKADPGAGDGQL